MLVWCALLFGLGVLAFMDSLFNYGEIFRRINSVLFLLTSLGLLIRTSMKMKIAYIENLKDRIEELENIVGPNVPQHHAMSDSRREAVR